jgi:hypothetical protein
VVHGERPRAVMWAPWEGGCGQHARDGRGFKRGFTGSGHAGASGLLGGLVRKDKLGVDRTRPPSRTTLDDTLVARSACSPQHQGCPSIRGKVEALRSASAKRRQAGIIARYASTAYGQSLSGRGHTSPALHVEERLLRRATRPEVSPNGRRSTQEGRPGWGRPPSFPQPCELGLVVVLGVVGITWMDFLLWSRFVLEAKPPGPVS